MMSLLPLLDTEKTLRIFDPLVDIATWSRNRIEKKKSNRRSEDQVIEPDLLVRTSSTETSHCLRKEFFVPIHGHPIWVREVIPKGEARDGVVVFVHGNTFPTVADFDLPVEGGSLVEKLALRGVTSWLFDHRGYGRSFKPATGRLGLAERADDLRAVLHYLTQSRRPRHVTVFGLSSAAGPIARCLELGDSDITSLVFLGPTYRVNDFLMGLIRRLQILHLLDCLRGNPENCYVTLHKELLRKRLSDGETGGISEKLIELFIDVSIRAMDPSSNRLRSPVIGFIEPGRKYALGDRLYDASVINRPFMLLRGSRDDFCRDEDAHAFLSEVGTRETVEYVLQDIKHDFGLYPSGKEDPFEALSSYICNSWG